MRRLVESAAIEPGELVLEVGGGTGGLTDLLVSRAGSVVCVELDRDLQVILEDRFGRRPQSAIACPAGSVSTARPGRPSSPHAVGRRPGFVLVKGDVLAGKHELCPAVAERIREHGSSNGAGVKLVSNLPYQVATPLVMNLLVDYPEVTRLCFTVQEEVGERLVAGPCCKAYGPLSIVSQAMCEVETIAHLPAHVFWPRPGVDSVMIRMDRRPHSGSAGAVPRPMTGNVHRNSRPHAVGRRPEPLVEPGDAGPFSRFVRQVFDHRRKTLRSALAYVLDEAVCARAAQAFDLTRRPESLSVEEWKALFALCQS